MCDLEHHLGKLVQKLKRFWANFLQFQAIFYVASLLQKISRLKNCNWYLNTLHWNDNIWKTKRNINNPRACGYEGVMRKALPPIVCIFTGAKFKTFDYFLNTSCTQTYRQSLAIIDMSTFSVSEMCKTLEYICFINLKLFDPRLHSNKASKTKIRNFQFNIRDNDLHGIIIQMVFAQRLKSNYQKCI